MKIGRRNYLTTWQAFKHKLNGCRLKAAQEFFKIYLKLNMSTTYI